MGNQARMQEMIELFEAELRLCGLDSSQVIPEDMKTRGH